MISVNIEITQENVLQLMDDVRNKKFSSSRFIEKLLFQIEAQNNAQLKESEELQVIFDEYSQDIIERNQDSSIKDTSLFNPMFDEVLGE